MTSIKSANRSAILITHGTDTLEWAYDAVRYAVKNNIVNIAITGSQIPKPDGVGDFSDAYANIGNSIRFLTQFTPPHIFTVFNNGQNASGFSPLGIIKEISAEIPVVALGSADFIYENAWETVVAGAISGVDLSIPEIQIRLSYLRGYKAQFEAYCQEHGATFKEVFEWLFISGMKFRTHRSRRKYEELRKTTFDRKDLLINYTFEESLSFYNKK